MVVTTAQTAECVRIGGPTRWCKASEKVTCPEVAVHLPVGPVQIAITSKSGPESGCHSHRGPQRPEESHRHGVRGRGVAAWHALHGKCSPARAERIPGHGRLDHPSRLHPAPRRHVNTHFDAVPQMLLISPPTYRLARFSELMISSGSVGMSCRSPAALHEQVSERKIRTGRKSGSIENIQQIML